MLRQHALAALVTTVLTMLTSAAFAGGVFLEVPMTRAFVCRSADATIDIFLPQSLLSKRNIEKQGLGRTVNGLYALELTGAQQSKVIEPVRLRSTKDNKAMTVELFTRKGLKPATLPLTGGELTFDPRSDARVKCEAFRPS